MPQSSRRLSAAELNQFANSPQTRLLMILSGADGSGRILSPQEIEPIFAWISSLSPDHPEFQNQDKWAVDWRHLGLVDEQGQLDEALAVVARDFIRQRVNQAPHYQALWRHLKAHAGLYLPEDPKTDYTEFTELVAGLLDDGTEPIALTQAILQAAAEDVAVPTQALWQADRVRLMLELFPDTRHHVIKQELVDRDINWFPMDAVGLTIRRVLRDKAYGLGEDELNAFLEKGKPGLLRQLKGFFGDANKARTLRDLGILDSSGQWSELGFQREQALVAEARQSERDPSLEWLRFELHRRHRPEEPVPFAWALMNDALLDPTVVRARRLGSIALSGGMLGDSIRIADTITPTQYRCFAPVGRMDSRSPRIPTSDRSVVARVPGPPERHQLGELAADLLVRGRQDRPASRSRVAERLAGRCGDFRRPGALPGATGNALQRGQESRAQRSMSLRVRPKTQEVLQQVRTSTVTDYART